MSYYISELKRLASEKKISLKELSALIGMTEAGFHQAMNKNTLKIEKLFKICDVLNVSPCDLLKKDVDVIKEDNPTYGLGDTEILKEVLKSIKRIEDKLDNNKPGK